MTAEDGAALRRWVDGGTALDPRVEQARGLLQNVAEQGVEALKQSWERTPKTVQKALGRQFIEATKASAEAYDRQRQLERDGGTSHQADSTIGALNAAMATQTAAPLAPPAPAPMTTAPAAAPADDDVF